jgi:hypothetical protein
MTTAIIYSSYSPSGAKNQSISSSVRKRFLKQEMVQKRIKTTSTLNS